jgi:hypothetical protein
MNLDDLYDRVEETDANVTPQFRLWIRNLKRDRDHDRIDAALCDRIAELVWATAGDQLDCMVVATVLGAEDADSPLLEMRLKHRTTCQCKVATVVSVAKIARHHTTNGYDTSQDGVDQCARDIVRSVLGPTELTGTLRGVLDHAWLTDHARLQTQLDASDALDTPADRARAALGLAYPQGEHLALLSLQASDANLLIAIPTTVDAAGHPYFLASRRDDSHGWTLHTDRIERSLPEWIIRGLAASSALELRALGQTSHHRAVPDWNTIIDRCDRGEV